MKRIPLLLSGVPGRMAHAIAELVSRPPWQEGFELLPVGLSSDARSGQRLAINGTTIELLGPAHRENGLLAHNLEGAIAVDFSTPTAAIGNVAFYTRAGIPFVMGTTGFVQVEAAAMVRRSNISAVIAPNMAIPIVVMQAALEWAARNFPGALEGMTVAIRESHQAAKRDTSGTARYFAGLFASLGLGQARVAIDSIRDPEAQRALGVPEEFIAGHGWHWYEARNADGSLAVDLSHRINGRSVYAEGALRAVEFLAVKRRRRSTGEVFSMSDVLAQDAVETPCP